MFSLTVRHKLGLAFGALTLIVLMVALASITMLSAANQRFENFVNNLNDHARAMEQLRVAVDKRAIAARNLVLVTKPEDLGREREAVLKAHELVTSGLARLNQIATEPDATQDVRLKIAAIDQIEKLYAPVALGIVDLALKGEREQAIRRMNDDCRPLLARLSLAADDYAAYSARHADAMVSDAHAAYIAQRNALLLGVALALIFSVLAGAFIERRLAEDLGAEPRELRSIFADVAAGNLAHEIRLRPGDNDSVLAAVQRMQQGLSRIVLTVRQGAEQVSSAAEQISAGNLDLAERTRNQANALEQTTTSMARFGSTVQQNADHAREANQLAQSASTVASHGGAAVAKVVETMQGINDSSRKISDIIGVIDSIAFQTNILALNAAVEAARAGEQGRGFAVVASEVRNLAQRSSEAAREIKTLITDSVGRVEQGASQVEDAGRTMAEIVAGINRVTEVVGAISHASGEQSQGVIEVGNVVSSMDQLTHQNATMVSQISAAAQSLNTKAHELVHTMAAFRLA